MGDLVYLRYLQVEDADELLALRVANRDYFRPLEPTLTDMHFTLEGQRADIERLEEERKADASYVFGIYEGANDRLVGRIGLSAVFRKAWQNANLGYYIGEDFGGNGYGTEAVGLCVKFAFEEARLHRVQAAVLLDNVASKRVLEKAGFRLEGLARKYLRINDRWEDHHIFAITVEEYETGGSSAAR